MGTIAIAVNLKNRAITQYHGIPIGGMAIFDGRFFIADFDGIYQFGYEFSQDKGEQIAAYAQLAGTDIGIPNKKTAKSHHLSFYADGELRVTWTADQTQLKEEEVTKGSSYPNHQDVKIRGNAKIAGTYFSYRIDNVKGSDFTLNALRIVPIVKPLGKNR